MCADSKLHIKLTRLNKRTSIGFSLNPIHINIAINNLIDSFFCSQATNYLSMISSSLWAAGLFLLMNEYFKKVPAIFALKNICGIRKCPRKVTIELQETTTPQSKLSNRCLGFQLNWKLCWKLHITDMKNSCVKKMNILKKLAHTSCWQKLHMANLSLPNSFKNWLRNVVYFTACPHLLK